MHDASTTPHNSGNNTLVKVAAIFGLLFLFLLAIQLLGDSFKLLGKDFSEQLVATTSDPFVGLFVGILATVLVQSSSVTTSVIVGLVSGGALTVSNAIPMIMGANIGTTVTNTLVSLGHVSREQEFERAFAGATMHDFFNFMTVAILFPLELMTGYLSKVATWMATTAYGYEVSTFKSPVKALVKPPAKAIKGFLTDSFTEPKLAGVVLLVLSIAAIFGALFFLVKLLRSSMMERVKVYIDKIFGNSALVTMAVGMAVTIMVQSSSITTSIMVPLVATGILTLEHAFPLTLGANIGTTITALMAALVGNVAGLTIACVHLVFNLSGIALIMPIQSIRAIPLNMARRLARVAVRNRALAFGYVFFLFFVTPFLFVLASRMSGS